MPSRFEFGAEASGEARPCDSASPVDDDRDRRGSSEILTGNALDQELDRTLRIAQPAHPARDLRWLRILEAGFRHRPYLVQFRQGENVQGRLPLAFVKSALFGRMLVSLPYVNSGGVQAETPEIAKQLIDAAVALADQLNCRYLELRHEQRYSHPALTMEMDSKVHLRLTLPTTAGTLWDKLKSSVRNQVRKGQRQGFTVRWGGEELLRDFYQVFSHTMRNLGTPVFGQSLFRSILTHLSDRAEFCGIYDGRRWVASGLLLHGTETTEVPSAAALHRYRPTNANMLLYWHLLERAVQRGQHCFDFGRSTVDSPTYRFKKQWGAQPSPACWQYYLRSGSVDALRPENESNQRLIKIWKRLPVRLTRWLGPPIVRGIP